MSFFLNSLGRRDTNLPLLTGRLVDTLPRTVRHQWPVSCVLDLLSLDVHRVMVTRFQAEDVGLVLGLVVEGEHHGEGSIPTVQPVMVLQLQSTSQLLFTFFFINNLILVVTLFLTA